MVPKIMKTKILGTIKTYKDGRLLSVRPYKLPVLVPYNTSLIDWLYKNKES